MLNKVRKKISIAIGEVKYKLDLMRHASKLPPLTAQDRLVVNACRREGAFMTSLEDLGLASTSAMLKAAERQLAVMDAVRSQQPNADTLGTADNPAYPQIFTVTDLEEFATWGQEQRLLNIIENYIGLPVKFQGVHLRRDFANERPVTTELWHRDLEDRRVIKVFVYLSDVEAAHGPFEYIPTSAVTPSIVRRINAKILQRVISKPGDMGIDDDEMTAIVPRSQWKNCPGPAGTVLFADPIAVFHHGKSRQKSRSMLFFVYTAANPLRPEDCQQYSDRTFARPDQLVPQA